MVNFYESSKIVQLKRDLTIFRILFYLVFAIFLGAETVFSLLIEYKNKNILQPLMIACGLLLASALLVIYLYFVLPNKWMIRRIEFMNNSIKHKVIGKVNLIKENVTLRRDIVGKEIRLNDGKNNTIYYLENTGVDFEFEDKTYVFETFDNFIITVEEFKK